MVSRVARATSRWPSPADPLERKLRLRLDGVLGRLHGLTLRRDAGELTLQESLPLEMSLVTELGHIQDRLRIMGCHTYDGCAECRPSGADKSAAPLDERNEHGR